MQISEGEVFLQFEGDSRQLFDYRLVAEVALESESIIGGDACWGGGLLCGCLPCLRSPVCEGLLVCACSRFDLVWPLGCRGAWRLRKRSPPLLPQGHRWR